MKEFIFIWLFLFCAHSVAAQYRTDARIRVHFENEKDSLKGVYIGDCNSDYGLSSIYINKSSQLYEGFTVICNLLQPVSLHIEKNDDFIIHIPDVANSAKVTYTGSRGAIKNDYIRERQEFIKQLESKPDFLEKDSVQFKIKIQDKRDSLLSVVRSLQLTDRFYKDETLFWQFYLENYLMFYDGLKAGDADITKVDPSRFKDESYYSQFEQYNFFDYRRMTYAYYYYKINSVNSYETLRDLYKSARTNLVQRMIVEICENFIHSRHPQSQLFAKLRRRKSKSYWNNSEIYKTVNKTQRGDWLDLSALMDVSGRTVNIEKASKKPTYIYFYSGDYGQGFDDNFAKWNEFYLRNKDSGYRFLTIGCHLKNTSVEIQNYLTYNKVAGVHLLAPDDYVEDIIDNSGLSFYPTIIETNENFLLQNWNLPADLKQVNIIEFSRLSIPWILKVGMRH